MDESTNSLDIKTEDNILRELKAISQKITLIFISHRPQSLNICDEVFTLEDGKLIKSE